MEKDDHMRNTLTIALVLLALAVSGFGQTLINGAGATFPYPIYSKWFDEFHKLHSDVQINYQSIGSGGGIRQLEAGTVDFGASDVPMTAEQLAKQKVPPLHLPTVLGGVVPTYNIPGVTAELNFTQEALAGIFLGTVKKWNDPASGESQPGREAAGRGYRRGAPLRRQRDLVHLDGFPVQGQSGLEEQGRIRRFRAVARWAGRQGQ